MVRGLPENVRSDLDKTPWSAVTPMAHRVNEFGFLKELNEMVLDTKLFCSVKNFRVFDRFALSIIETLPIDRGDESPSEW